MTTLARADAPMQFSELTSAIRALAMDMVQQAASGHPGMPMGMADIAEVLWNDHLRHNPADPKWPNRDRFILSNGHGSALQYALLHLSGYDLPLDELKRFRQLHSKTPGHPEVDITPGVEVTTGPLGQGLANAVGMALAEKSLGQEFNRPGHNIVDHYTYVFLGDGCLMEGISHEACSLAGTLGLGKLICFYDDNNISIDGEVDGWFTDNTPERFAAYGWQVLADIDGHDRVALGRAIVDAKAELAKPTLICCKTVIGMGAPNKAGTAKVHGEALGTAEIAASRQLMGWPYAPFEIPEHVAAAWDARERGAGWQAAWQAEFGNYRRQSPELAAEFLRRMSGQLPDGWGEQVRTVQAAANTKGETVATRKASQQAIEGLAPVLPELLGGSADLTVSNLTAWSGSVRIGKAQAGNYICYGVREFGMAAMMNGLALHGGYIPYGGTFLMFSEYARNAVRMAALMKLRSIFVFTHDSIGLGEDGPTHQAVEQVATLRMVPNLDVWRPCDTLETAHAWSAAIERKNGPSALILSRQALPFQQRESEVQRAIAKGGYVLCDAVSERPLQAVILSSGSEVALAIAAQCLLAAKGINVRVVSMPCCSVFDRQDAAYRDSVLPPGVPRVAVEAGVRDGWYKYVHGGEVVGIDCFGESAPADELFVHFGLTGEHVSAAVQRVLKDLK